MGDREWRDLEDALAVVLADLPPGGHLILEVRASTNRYMQFVDGGAPGFRGEVVSDHFLDDSERWGPAGSESLAKLGWLPPDATQDEIDHPELYRDSPASNVNYHVQWRNPAPFGDVARIACETLRDAFGVATPTELSYSSMDAAGVPVVQPLLEDRLGE